MALTKSEIEKFKKRLLELRKEHMQVFQELSTDIKMPEEARGAALHHADHGDDDVGKTMSIEVSAKEMQVVKQIDRALAKIEEGSYGICDVSGLEISKKRLEAIPYAIMTVESQSDMEKGLL